MAETLSVLYLHGFASGPQSRKALFFAERLGRAGVPLRVPDLAEGDFEHLTITRQLALIDKLIGDQPHIVIGSSLGGYLTALYSARHPKAIERAVLLAPAFGFRQLWEAKLGPEACERWKRDGKLDVFHYGQGREVPLSYGFFEDARRYEPFPKTGAPAIIFHGDEDAVVPVEQSVAFVESHPRCRLRRLSSGHELTDVLEVIWDEASSFLAGENGP